MDLVGAIIAGLAGTVVFSMLMMLGPKMGMPKMEIWAMLGSMFNPKGNLTLGWILHLMMGAIFGIIYAACRHEIRRRHQSWFLHVECRNYGIYGRFTLAHHLRDNCSLGVWLFHLIKKGSARWKKLISNGVG